MLPRVQTGLLWDYENVPLRSSDYHGFLLGLRFLFERYEIPFFQIFGRYRTISDDDYQLLVDQPYIDPESFKWIVNNSDNAVDYAIFKAAHSMISEFPEISQIILISGDGDFYELVDDLSNFHMIAIYQEKSYDQHLVSRVNLSYSVEFISRNPQNWFGMK